MYIQHVMSIGLTNVRGAVLIALVSYHSPGSRSGPRSGSSGAAASERNNHGSAHTSFPLEKLRRISQFPISIGPRYVWRGPRAPVLSARTTNNPERVQDKIRLEKEFQISLEDRRTIWPPLGSLCIEFAPFPDVGSGETSASSSSLTLWLIT